MITASIPDDMSDDPYGEALCLRAALCAASLEVRAVDPAAADQFLNEERALARSMPAP
jgi:hypothetical protein